MIIGLSVINNHLSELSRIPSQNMSTYETIGFELLNTTSVSLTYQHRETNLYLIFFVELKVQ